MGDGRWARGDGRWAMGKGRWARGEGTWASSRFLRAVVGGLNAEVSTTLVSNAQSRRVADGMLVAPFAFMSKSKNLRQRSFQFAVDIIAFTRGVIERDPHLRPVVWQLLDSAGSTGANLEE